MKKLFSIVGINFILVFMLFICANSFNMDSEMLLKSLFSLVALNCVLGLISFVKKKRLYTRQFFLSSIVLLIIGTPACVTIKLKKKIKKPEQQEQKDSLKLANSAAQLKWD